MIPEVVYMVAGIGIGVVAVFFLRKPAKDNSNELAKRIDSLAETVDRRLHENATLTNQQIGQAQNSVRAISQSLGKLEQATASLQTTNQEISNFQKLLTSPKVRGSFGEVLLGNLLAEVLPADRFSLQHTLRSTGQIADAIIKLQDNYIVAIDAKFPLANFEREERKAFVRDVKKHITDISQKYIAPQEQTLDYAFMYIPLEGVYYETMVRDEAGEALWAFGLERKVIPVSPNSFLAYLQTVLVGLKGMKVQEQTREILQNVAQLRKDFGRFGDDFAIVGTHLTNAKNRYDDSLRQLDKFTNKLEQIDSTTNNVAELPEQSLE